MISTTKISKNYYKDIQIIFGMVQLILVSKLLSLPF